MLFVFCAPPGLARLMDFCLRLDMPSGALPAALGFEVLALGLLLPDLVLGPDLPLLDVLGAGAILGYVEWCWRKRCWLLVFRTWEVANFLENPRLDRR
jgi:hypothetical protein